MRPSGVRYSNANNTPASGLSLPLIIKKDSRELLRFLSNPENTTPSGIGDADVRVIIWSSGKYFRMVTESGGISDIKGLYPILKASETGVLNRYPFLRADSHGSASEIMAIIHRNLIINRREKGECFGDNV